MRTNTLTPRVIVSALSGSSIVETTYDPVERRTRLCAFEGDTWSFQDELTLNNSPVVPYSPYNNLLRHGVVLFPSEPSEYGSDAQLITDIRAFIHRYVDLSPLFEEIAVHYVRLSWLYDTFNDVPYLRVRGDFGSGKTRFLLTVGSLCHKPMFASGASTVSPLFRIIDAFQGTLVLDESDFRFSDEKAEIIKILNNGNARGFPVLRAEATDTNKHEYNPRAYAVYGPKIIATRGTFDDRALESRCITEDLGLRALRRDIPISLPDAFAAEACALRNKLLLFRFRNRLTLHPDPQQATDHGLEPRLRQVFAPLLTLIRDNDLKKGLEQLQRSFGRQLVLDRGMSAEGQVLEILYQLLQETPETPIALSDAASAFAARFGAEYQWKPSPRWIGGIMRARLQLRPRKSHGVYVLPPSEYPKLALQFQRYGIGREEEAAA